MNVRQRLSDLVAASNLTQKELAARVGENRQWVNNRLRGEVDIHADDISRFATALGVSPSALFQQSSLAEMVLAVFLRVLAEMPPNYRQELWDLAARLETPRPLHPASTGGQEGRSQPRRDDGRSTAEKTHAYLTQAWEELPQDDKESILEIIEARRRLLGR